MRLLDRCDTTPKIVCFASLSGPGENIRGVINHCNNPAVAIYIRFAGSEPYNLSLGGCDAVEAERSAIDPVDISILRADQNIALAAESDSRGASGHDRLSG